MVFNAPALAKAASLAYKAAKYGSAAAAGAGVARGVIRLNARKPLRGGSRGYKKYGGVAEGHAITADTSTNFKRLSKKAIALKEAVPQLSRTNTKSVLVSAEGYQSFNDVTGIWVQSDLNGIIAQTTSSESRFFIEGASSKMVMTNMTSTPVFLTVYDWQAKDNNNSVAPSTAITNSLSAKYATANMQNYPWMNPKEAKQFTANFRVIKATDLVLSPGETHIHNFYVAINKYYDNVITSNLGANSYVKNITCGQLIRVIGTPVTDDTKVSYAATKVVTINHVTLNWKVPQGVSGARLVATQVGTPETGLTSEKFMEQETGVTTVNTVA